jgi:hypothetical protein
MTLQQSSDGGRGGATRRAGTGTVVELTIKLVLYSLEPRRTTRRRSEAAGWG